MSLPIKIELPEGFLEEEIRCGYTVSSEMKKVWAVELDLLNEFMRVCNENNIEFSACGGTVLGAVRHNGFIPWDDDIDLYMRREQYEKLCNIAKDYFKFPYFFQTEETDKGSSRGHIQLRNSLTTGILYSELDYKCKFNQGIFIDIFPIDNIPNLNEEQEEFFSILRKAKKYYKSFGNLQSKRISRVDTSNFSKYLIKKILSFFISSTKLKNPFFKKFEKCLTMYNNNNSCKYEAELVVEPGKKQTIFKKEIYGNLILWPFEQLLIPIPKNYDELLTIQYGEWHKMIVSKSTHGDVFFDTSQPYVNYIRGSNK